MDPVRKVAVFGGDPVIGRALVLLLQAAGYRVSLLYEGSLDDRDSLKEIELILLAPGWSASGRERLLKALNGGAGLIPVLELGASEEGDPHPENLVSWPCHTEELERCIDEALHYFPESGG